MDAIVDALNWGLRITNDSWVLASVTAFFVSIVLLGVFRSFILRYMERISSMTRSELDDMLVKVLKDIPGTVYLLFALYVSLQFAPAPPFVNNVLRYAVTLVTVYYGIKLAHTAINHFRDRFIAKRRMDDPKEDMSVIHLLASMLKYSLWVFGFLLVLANMQIDVSALIAGMGVGGIAVALAAQNILDDIFSSFSIYFDKPYRVGDFILIGTDMGEVQKIGIKTTRVKTLRGEELVVSNKEMTNTRVHNFGRMPHRRVEFKLGVTYETPLEKLKDIPGIIRQIVESHNLVRLDRVHFKAFGDFSLNFEAVYYLDSPDYNLHMDVQEAINYEIMAAFEREGIHFAYPTQTLILRR